MLTPTQLLPDCSLVPAQALETQGFLSSSQRLAPLTGQNQHLSLMASKADFNHSHWFSTACSIPLCLPPLLFKPTAFVTGVITVSSAYSGCSKCLGTYYTLVISMLCTHREMCYCRTHYREQKLAWHCEPGSGRTTHGRRRNYPLEPFRSQPRWLRGTISHRLTHAVRVSSIGKWSHRPT